MLLIVSNVEIAVPLKYLSNFWKTIEMLNIICKINLILTWSAIVLLEIQGARTFSTTDTIFYVTVVTLSTQCMYLKN